MTTFSRAVFGKGHEVTEHVHASMDEIFYVEEGEGIFEIDGVVVQVRTRPLLGRVSTPVKSVSRRGSGVIPQSSGAA